MRHDKHSSGFAQIVVLIIVVCIVSIAGIFLLLHRDHAANKPSKQTTASTKNLSSYCVSHTFAIASSGNCVGDIQTMTNYIENSGLTQCPFAGGALLLVSALYDDQTGAQIRAVQQWAVCYARQEGFTTNITPSGTVDKATWGELCTYSYTNPSHNGASGASAAIAAGNDAGCAQLQS